jgi:hypothetical protein
MQPRGLHGGYHHGILSRDCGGFSPTASPPNPAMALIVTYEYLFCLPSSDRLRPPAREKAQGYCQGLVPYVPRATYYDPKF